MWNLKFNDQTKMYYYVSDDGRKTKEYANAFPYVKGSALLQKDDGYWYFRREDGKFEKTPYSMSKVIGADNLLIITEKVYGRNRLYNLETGAISSEYNSMSRQLRDGWGIAQGHRYCNFFDATGNFAKKPDEIYFISAKPYCFGWSLVEYTEGFGSEEHYGFRDKDGNLVGRYKYARKIDEVTGKSIVMSEDEDVYRFRDSDGNLSQESYHFIKPSWSWCGQLEDENIPFGVFQVMVEKDGPIQYLDYAGNLSEKAMPISTEFASYLAGEKLENLGSDVFANDKIYKAIYEHESKVLGDKVAAGEMTTAEASKIFDYIENRRKIVTYNESQVQKSKVKDTGKSRVKKANIASLGESSTEPSNKEQVKQVASEVDSLDSEFKKYLNGEVELEALSIEIFANQENVDAILAAEQNKFDDCLDKCQTEEDVVQLEALAENVVNYIFGKKQEAEARQRLEDSKRKAKNTIANLFHQKQ